VRRRPVRPSIQTQHLPAPLDGLNTVATASEMAPTECVYGWNFIPGDKGLDVRPGYAEWCTGLTGKLNDEVRTILSFAGATYSANKMFAVTSTGIWDVTSSSAAPSQVFAFASSANEAGYGVGKVVVTSGGHFLLYCDEENGLHIYTSSTDTWAAAVGGGGAGEIGNVDPADLVFVGTFKGRVWFAERDSSKAWYLDAGSITGAATSFELGGQFPHGGTLVEFANWTYDGGSGMDDSLVFRSSGGDLAIYQGTDPASADTFGLKGVWYTGDSLKGRRTITETGGDVMLLSRLGALSLSQLVIGAGAQLQGVYATAKISNLFVALAAEFGSSPGWSVHVHPTANALLVTIPSATGAAVEQLAMSFANKSWWRWRDLPILSAATFDGQLYFGTTDGRVCRNTGYVDNVLLSSTDAWDPVAWSVLPAFQNLGQPTEKQIVQVRPTILAGNEAASVQATAKYGYDFNEPTVTVGNGGGGSGAWDSGVWDTAIWGGETTATQPILGTSGIGREVSVALQGNAISSTTLVGVDVYFTQGGTL
jgi:hypothetical protein